MYYSREYRGHEELISVNMAENLKNVATVKNWFHSYFVCLRACTGPQMIPKWSPNWNANDCGLEIVPGGDHKWIRLKNKEWHGYGNDENRELGWITIIFVKTILNYGLQLASFGYFFHTTMLWMAPS